MYHVVVHHVKLYVKIKMLCYLNNILIKYLKIYIHVIKVRSNCNTFTLISHVWY